MSTTKNYKTIKESRCKYFVEYYPYRISLKIAILNIVITAETFNKNELAIVMERELQDWLKKYPAPLSVYAYDDKEDLINLDEINKLNPLVGFLNDMGELVKGKEYPAIDLDQDYLDGVYSNIEFSTDAEYDADKEKRRYQIETGFILLFLLPIVIALVYEAFVYFNKLFSLLAFLYIILRAFHKAFAHAHIWPKSKREKEKEQDEALKNHYYYYCKMNPEGFEKLKLESLEKMTRERVKKEAASLNIHNI